MESFLEIQENVRCKIGEKPCNRNCVKTIHRYMYNLIIDVTWHSPYKVLCWSSDGDRWYCIGAVLGRVVLQCYTYRWKNSVLISSLSLVEPSTVSLPAFPALHLYLSWNWNFSCRVNELNQLLDLLLLPCQIWTTSYGPCLIAPNNRPMKTDSKNVKRSVIIPCQLFPMWPCSLVMWFLNSTYFRMRSIKEQCRIFRIQNKHNSVLYIKKFTKDIDFENKIKK